MFNQEHPYYNKLLDLLVDFRENNPKAKIFIFGSAVMGSHFNDIDIAIDGEFLEQDLVILQEMFEESTFPYIIDLRNLKEADKSFLEHIHSLPKL